MIVANRADEMGSEGKSRLYQTWTDPTDNSEPERHQAALARAEMKAFMTGIFPITPIV